MLEPLRANSVRWYALYTRSRFEKKVHDQLSKKKIESYLPLVEEIRTWSDRRRQLKEPLFKGYVFVCIDLRNRQHVLETEGVVRLVGTRNGPTAISNQEIEAIKTIFSNLRNVKGLRREKVPVVGEQVKITAGPLRGLKGIVLEVRNITRLVILVEAIASAFSIEILPDFIAREN